MSQTLLDKLRAWHTFYDEVAEMTDEEQLRKLYALEEKHFQRAYVLLRIYGRLNVLRTRRERLAIKEKYGTGAAE